MAKFIEVHLDSEEIAVINIENISFIKGQTVYMQTLTSVVTAQDNFGRRLNPQEPIYHLENIMLKLDEPSMKLLRSALDYA